MGTSSILKLMEDCEGASWNRGYVSHLQRWWWFVAYQYVVSTIIRISVWLLLETGITDTYCLLYGELKQYCDSIKKILVIWVQTTSFLLFPHHRGLSMILEVYSSSHRSKNQIEWLCLPTREATPHHNKTNARLPECSELSRMTPSPDHNSRTNGKLPMFLRIFWNFW